MASIKIERLNHAFQEEISMILMTEIKDRSEEHTSELQVTWPSRMPSSA